MKISTGIGLRFSPELAVLSPLSLLQSLTREELLSRRSSNTDRCTAGLKGVRDFGDFREGRLGDFVLIPLLVGEPDPRLKRCIQEDGESGVW